MKKLTLKEIIDNEMKHRNENGAFGIKECKRYIKEIEIELLHKDLFECLKEYYKRANEDVFFNKAMVLACWELINE